VGSEVWLNLNESVSLPAVIATQLKFRRPAALAPLDRRDRARAYDPEGVERTIPRGQWVISRALS